MVAFRETPDCNFNGYKRNMRQQHLTAVITELIARFVRRAAIFLAWLWEKVSCKLLVVAISFLDLLKFIAIAEFVIEVLSVNEIVLRL
jgi:hypothetical protein